MASPTLSQTQMSKEKTLQKLREAQAVLADAYEESLLAEIADEIVNIGRIIYDIEQNM